MPPPIRDRLVQQLLRKGMPRGKAQALEIRERYARGGVTQAALAREYGVHQPTVSSICSGKTWGHA
jgi:predicted transcriptional regulator